MDRGAWQATVHGLTKNQTRLSTPTHVFLLDTMGLDSIFILPGPS